MRKPFLFLLLLAAAATVRGETVRLEIEVPALDASPYHRPYVAAWLETPQRQGVHTLGVWYDDTEWLKDMRQWWRKLGRSSDYDAVTGATKPPGFYRLEWSGNLPGDKTLAAGDYLLSVEAAREEGGREYLRQSVVLGKDTPQQYTLEGGRELGTIRIEISP